MIYTIRLTSEQVKYLNRDAGKMATFFESYHGYGEEMLKEAASRTLDLVTDLLEDAKVKVS